MWKQVIGLLFLRLTITLSYRYDPTIGDSKSSGWVYEKQKKIEIFSKIS